MGVSMLDNINYKGQKPDNSRSQFDTIEEMVAYSENYLPAIYVTLCAETGKQYKYQRSNTVDPELGKWREVGEGGGSGVDTYSKVEIDEKTKNILDQVGDLSKLFSGELKDLVSAINVVYGVGAGDFAYSDKKVIITLRNGGTKEIDCSPIITDTTLEEFKNVDINSLKDAQALIYNGATEKWENKDIDLAGVLEQSKTYTDEEISKSEMNNAIGCDAKPTFDGSSITYIQGGVSKTTEDVSKWFYYTSGTGVAQTRWISGIEFTIDIGAINLTDYVNKNTDVTGIFEENPVDLTKVPNLEYMKALRDVLLVAIGKKLNKTDIVDTLLSEATDAPLSANQGKVLKEMVDGKLDVQQTVEDAGKVLKVGPDGKIALSEGGGEDASAVSYEVATHPEWSTVKKALDGLIAKVEYVKPAISSFTSNAQSVYEIGQKVSSINFSWSTNKDVTSQTLTDCTITASDRTATYNTELSSNKTFTLTIGDGENTDSKSISIAFRNKIYFGGAAEPGDYDSAFILGLAKSQFATSKSGSFSMTVGSGEYGYIAFPKSFGSLSSVKIGGFDTDVISCGDIAFTNASGGVVTYSIYRTGRSGLGSLTMVVA